MEPNDPRPITFPPPGPYWISGYVGEELEEAILIAYLPNKSDLKKYWPEAKAVEWSSQQTPIEFTSRFPQPTWWNETESSK